MGIMSGLVRRTLLSLGYEIYRSGDPRVAYGNFENLAKSYERCLGEAGNHIPPNDARPQLLGRLIGTTPTEAYFIVQALAKCRDVVGDVCEFGVAQGETSALIANEIIYPSYKILHLFDSFEGLPAPSDKDQLKDDIFALGNMAAYEGKMSCPQNMVRSRLRAIAFPSNRYVIHQGFIDQVLRHDATLPKSVCFAYVDFDFYDPTKRVLEYLHGTTPNGAVIIIDDYGFFSTGAKTAVDEFIHEHNMLINNYSVYVPDSSCGYFAVLTRQ